MRPGKAVSLLSGGLAGPWAGTGLSLCILEGPPEPEGTGDWARGAWVKGEDEQASSPSGPGWAGGRSPMPCLRRPSPSSGSGVTGGGRRAGKVAQPRSHGPGRSDE